MPSFWLQRWGLVAAICCLPAALVIFACHHRPPGIRAHGTNAKLSAAVAATPSQPTPNRTFTAERRSVPPAVQAHAVADPQQMPPWSIRFGAEFWRRSPPRSGTVSSADQQQHPVTRANIADAIERLSHVFQFEPISGTAVSAGAGFQAELCSKGVRCKRTRAQPDPDVPELTFETRSVSRAGAGLPQSGNAWVVIGNTAQRLLAADWGPIEHYEARAAGIEVAWILPQPPPGAGDLIIEVSVGGANRISPKGRGALFSKLDGTAELALGPTTVVDSAGQAWPVSLEIADHTARIRVPESVLAQATYPLAVDPLITPSFELDSPVNAPSPSTQASPAIAANSSGFLVVWTRGKGDGTEPAVLGARLDAQRRLLDPYGFLLSTAAGEQTVCAVAALEDSFLAVWSAPRFGSTTDWDLFGARIDSTGNVLDSVPFPICALSSSLQNSPAVAANGDNYLVVWRDSRQSGIYGTLVTPAGRVSVTNGFTISGALSDQFTPAVAALGTNYLVVWQDYRRATSSQYHSDIYGARVSGDGQVLDSSGLAICIRTNSQFNPSLAASGTNWLVAWEDYDAAGNDILAARVSEAGVVLDTNAIVVGRAANAQAYPWVAGAADWLLVWQDYRHTSTNDYAALVWANRVRADGTVETPGGFPISHGTGHQWRPKTVVNEGSSLVAWQDSTRYPSSTLAEIRAAPLDLATNAVFPDFLVSGAVNAQLSPAVAACGTNLLAVWSDTRDANATGRDIYGVRFTSAGSLLDPTAIPICTASNHQAEPVVAANHENFLVAWADWRNTPANASHADIFGTLVSPSGTVLQPEGIPICTATNDQRSPTITVLGDNFLLVWQDPRRSAGASLDLFGCRVSPTGTVLDPAGIFVSLSGGNQSVPSIAAIDSQALVVWSDTRSGATAADIYGARINADGSVLDTNGFPICTASLVQTNPAVASDGQRFLAVWADGRAGTGARFDIYATFIDSDSRVQPTNGFPVRVGPAQQSGPAVAFDGTDYLVTWSEARAGSTNLFDVLGTGITSSGSIWPGGAMLLAPGLLTPDGTAAASLPNGTFVLANQVPLYSSSRITGETADLQSFPRFSSPALSNSQFVVQFLGRPGQRYRLETSSNLAAWQELKTVTLTNNSETLVEPIPSPATAKFYRAILLP